MYLKIYIVYPTKKNLILLNLGQMLTSEAHEEMENTSVEVDFPSKEMKLCSHPENLAAH